jgi:hypothetical protein
MSVAETAKLGFSVLAGTAMLPAGERKEREISEPGAG